MEAPEFERRVAVVVKASAERGDPPLLTAMEVGTLARDRGMGIPSLELGEALIANLCFANNTPSLWKLLDQALSCRLIDPIHALALLTSRVIPNRRAQPEAYRLYLELSSRYIFSFSFADSIPCREKMIKSIDAALQLSDSYGVHVSDIGQTVVFFLFSVLMKIIDCVLVDFDLNLDHREKSYDIDQSMDICVKENLKNKSDERRELLHKMNASLAMEVAERITAHRKARVLLRLVHLNMPEKFNCLLQRLQLIKTKISTSQSVIPSNHILVKLCANAQKAMEGGLQLISHKFVASLVDFGLDQPLRYYCSGADQPACWVSFDIFMERAMDGRNLHPTSAIDLLAALIRTLQVTNQASWQETFEALWVSALRLVQRDRAPLEGPIPHLDSRLCMLLSITPLAIAKVIGGEDTNLSVKIGCTYTKVTADDRSCKEGSTPTSRKRGLISSLQLLGQFTGLLIPPPPVIIAASTAASRAATYICEFKKGNDSFDVSGRNGTYVKANGNMLHLIVEACIARKLIDTSAYFWPGYVVTSSMPSIDSNSIQESPWSAFMERSQLNISLKNSLMTTPASSVAQVEQLYHIALNGSEEERSAAAMILCGASLTRGWNIQEHVVRIVVKLLSPPVPLDFAGSGSHLYGYQSMLSSILFGASFIDIVHIISLYGMVPEVAASLMPICEAYGSLSPTSMPNVGVSDESSVYSVFSCAFLFLLRMWKFYSPPNEHTKTERWGTVWAEMSLDYLLLMRNNRIASPDLMDIDRSKSVSESLDTVSTQPVYIDSFPKLRAWYFQNQACVASTLSGVSGSSPIHQVADKILNMICRRMGKSTGSSTSCNSSGSVISTGEDTIEWPMLPAWEILEALPFVLEAVLTACAIGRLSSRDLTTGLRDLVDFFPASLATIISYFSAEITRGIWKPVEMNGIDWPSPAANINYIESEIQEILASAGVHIPKSYSGRTLPIMLPLPMAALVGLTITFKLEKSLEYIHGVIGPALENCAACSPLPSMPIIGALWEQKVRRWHDFIVFSCARCPFRQGKDAISQLLKSCFTSFLGPSVSSGSHLTPQQGVNGLLGHAFADNGIRLPIAPGFLYLRSCRHFLDTQLVSHEILKLVSASARELASGWTCGGAARVKSSRVSLASAAARVKHIATLGASLLCITGGVCLVQVLFMETMPTWLLSRSERKKTSSVSPASSILEGYAMAYVLILSGSFMWGLGDMNSGPAMGCRQRCARAVSVHMDFIARALEGNVALGCDPVTWKAYVSCYLGLLLRFVPAWVSEVKQETLKKLAGGLRGWHECELALSLLERGGLEAMSSVLESI